jgi:hypothetical protein
MRTILRFALLGSTLLSAACGASVAQGSHDGSDSQDAVSATDGRLPIDEVAFVDASFDATHSMDASVPPDAAQSDSSINIFEVFPIPETGPIAECAACASDHCGTQVNGCFNDPTCRDGLTCTIANCLGGARDGGGGPGGLDFTCINNCFMGNLGAAAQAIGAFTCITNNCGMACTGALGGMGGDAGFGFDGGFGRDGGRRDGGPGGDGAVTADVSTD